ncbi:MAG: ATP-binding cassette domain-containing protein [Bryobacterales bacterium]|nr:ATP-binding cassette domain-containing protein [Acidobacteriota bacterium]MCB9383539.1 ATP-binding cassette domain-containing protein [Bryobacterales bacterium]
MRSSTPYADSPLDELRSPLEDGVSFDGKPIARLLALLRLERRDLWIVVIYSSGIGLFSLVVPVAVQAVVNFIAFGSMLQPLIVLTMFVLVALGFSAVMNAFRVFTVEVIQRRLFVRVATDFAQRLVRAKAQAFDRHYGPELVNRFFDVVTVQKSAAALLMESLLLIMQTVLGMLLLAVYHPLLLIFDIFLLIAMAVILTVLGRGAVPTAIHESKAKYEIAAWLEEIAAHVAVFKSPAGAAYGLGATDQLTQRYLDYRKAHFRVVMQQIVGALFLQAVASALLLGIGGFLVIRGQLTLGQLVAAELIVTTVVSGFSKLGEKLETYYDLLAAVDKLGEVIDLPMERDSGSATHARTGPASIELVDIDVQAWSDEPALDNVTLRVGSGERVGVTGPSGAGKSALAGVLYGLRRPERGVLLADGLDSRSLPLSHLREQAALVNASSVITETIERNVSMGRPDIELRDVQEALAKVDLLEDVLAFPDGLQTALSGRGAPLSDTQVVRLVLARAIAGKPRLLIVDDLLDRISDRATRNHICDTLFHPDAPWTLVCISNHPEVLARCERVVTIVDGAIRS